MSEDMKCPCNNLWRTSLLVLSWVYVAVFSVCVSQSQSLSLFPCVCVCDKFLNMGERVYVILKFPHMPKQGFK